MTIQDLGNIGEFVGSMGVLITLIYLARQYRSSTEQAKVESLNHALGVHVQQIVDLTATSEKSELFRKFCTDFDSLSLNERGQTHTVLLGLIVTFNQVIRMHKAGLLEEEEFNAIQGTMISILRTSGAGQWWVLYRSMVPESLDLYVTAAIKNPAIKKGPITEEQPWLFEPHGNSI